MEQATFYDCNESNVILHAFDWPYAQIAEQAATIRSLGYKSVLVSPPMKSLVSDEGTKWWQRYQPQDYRVIDNQLGNTESFTHMVQELTRHDLWVYADVVFNHMANESDIRLDLQYPNNGDMQSYREKADYYKKQTLFGDLSEPLFDEEDFVEAFGIKDWKDKWEVQNGRISAGPHDPGLPTLRDNDHVVEQQQNYLRALKEIGVRGFRIDAAKHMTLDHLIKVWTPEITDGLHIFGEIITDGGATEEEYELFLQPYLEHTRLGAYDFPLFSTVFEAFSKKGSLKSLINPYSLGQELSKPRSITFSITHDIPNNDVFLDKVMEEEQEWLATAYLLGRDGGVPLIYADLDTSGIKDANGKPRWRDGWKNERMQALIAFHNRMHGLPMTVAHADEESLVISRGEQGMLFLNKGDAELCLPVEGAGWLDMVSGEKVADGKGVAVGAGSFRLLTRAKLSDDTR